MFDVAQIVGEMPSRSKCAWFRGSFTRAITFGTLYFSFAIWQMMRLSSSSPVTASTRSGGRRMPGALEDEELRSVAAVDDVLELLLERREPVAALLDQRHLVTRAEQEAREVRADLSPADREDVHQPTSARCGTSQLRTASVRTSIAVEVGHTVRSPRSS